jgi:hypothetical protein
MNPYIISMAAMRFISSFIEFCAALLFLHSKEVETALRINALLGLVGPVIFAGVSFLGICAMAGKVSMAKLIIIFTGVILVLIGTTSN